MFALVKVPSFLSLCDPSFQILELIEEHFLLLVVPPRTACFCHRIKGAYTPTFYDIYQLHCATIHLLSAIHRSIYRSFRPSQNYHLFFA